MQKQTPLAIALLTLAGTGMFLACACSQSLPKRSDPPASSPATGSMFQTVNHEYRARRDALSRQSYVHYEMARELMKQGRLNKAEQETLEGLRLMQPLPDTTGYQLLGEIYLKGGQNQKALQSFQTTSRHTQNTRLGLNAALAYCRMGDYEHARQFNPDPLILQHTIGGKSLDRADLPGTDNLNDLEASILLARGMDAASTCDFEEAIANYQAASRYASVNPLIHYFWADALFADTTLGHQDRTAEAVSHFEAAAKRAHGVLLPHIQRQLYFSRGRLAGMRDLKARQTQMQAQSNAKP